MSTTNLNFAVAVKSWAAKAEQNLLKVFHLSFEFTLLDMIGFTPSRSGYLRASVEVAVNSIPAINHARDGTDGVVPPNSNHGSAIAAARLGDTLYAGFTASYGPRIEYGFMGTDSKGRTYSQSGHGMVRLAAQRFDMNVGRAAKAIGK